MGRLPSTICFKATVLDSPRELGDEASCAVRTFAEQSRSGIVLMDDVEYGNEDLSHKALNCWGVARAAGNVQQASTEKLSLATLDRAPGCFVPCSTLADGFNFEEAAVITVEEYPRGAQYDSRVDKQLSGKSHTSSNSLHDSLHSMDLGKSKGKSKTAGSDKLSTQPSIPDTAFEEELRPDAHDEGWITATIDPYDIFFTAQGNGKLSRLGRGAFGTVYKGMYCEEPVAVKVCRRANLNTAAMKQFQKEVSILQDCRHENVVRFIGACTWKGGQRTVLVTELMERGDLYSLLGRHQGRFAWHRLGRCVALDVARGLSFLHSRNIVHFDLKSGNVLLDKKYRAKLADVGLAKTLTTCHGCEGLATYMSTGELGTFAWAAPEVLLGLPCNAKADIYSFGVLLWELATSEIPQGRDLRYLSVPAEGPPGLQELINICLDTDPIKRPSADYIVHMIQHLL